VLSDPGVLSDIEVPDLLEAGRHDEDGEGADRDGPHGPPRLLLDGEEGRGERDERQAEEVRDEGRHLGAVLDGRDPDQTDDDLGESTEEDEGREAEDEVVDEPVPEREVPREQHEDQTCRADGDGERIDHAEVRSRRTSATESTMRSISFSVTTSGGASRIVEPWVSLASSPRRSRPSHISRPDIRVGSMSSPAHRPRARTATRPWPTSPRRPSSRRCPSSVARCWKTPVRNR